jgi:hypothetical protein
LSAKKPWRNGTSRTGRIVSYNKSPKTELSS